MPLTFYHGQGSPYSWRVWLALELKGIAYELEVLSFAAGDTKKPEFIAINPRHQVPTIVDDGFALWESTVVLEYLEDRYPATQPERSLYPGDAKNRARIRRLAREAEEYLGLEAIDPITTEYFFKADAAPDPARVAKAREAMVREFAYLEKELAGDFFAGAAPTAADIVLYPFLAYVSRFTFRKPELALTQLVPPRLAAWQKRIEQLPYFDKTFPPHWR